MRVRALCLASVAFAGCLPVHTSTRNHDTVVRQFEVEAERSAPEVQVASTTTPERLELTAQAVTTCTREQKKLVKRWRETEKTTDTGLHAVVYTLGILGVLGGGAVIYDTEQAATPEDRTFKIGDDLPTSRAVGISAAAAGGLLLVIGVASSIAASDDRKFLGDIEEPVPGTRATAECERKPAASTEIALLMPAQPGQPAPVVPLGKTDAQGKLVVAWADIKTPNGVRPEGELVVGAADALRGDVAIGKTPKGHGRVAGPAADPEVAWTAAVAANTPEAYDEFRTKHPNSPHATEALERARTAKARVALAKLDEALAANKLDVAGEQMTILRANGDPATIESAQGRLDAARKVTRLATARANVTKLVASIETTPDPTPVVAEVKGMIDAIREADVAEAAKVQIAFDDARKRAVKRLTKEGQDALARGDYAVGGQKFDIATTITVDVKAVARARTAAFAGATRTALGKARSLARDRRYDDAIAIADTLLKVAPDEKIAAEKATWIAAKERTAKEGADKAARDAARAEEAARLQADREARIAAAKQKIEDERAARAAKLEEDRARIAAEKAARAEAAKLKAEERKLREEAAKQQRIADAEARKRAAEEKRLADEAARAQRRADAAAKKDAAEQERLAREADRARVRAEAEARRAEEARLKAEEARRRAEEARTGVKPLPAVGSGIPPAKPLPPPGSALPPAKPVTVPPVSTVGSGIPPAKPIEPVKPAPTAAEQLAEARMHFTQGKALFESGDYNAALVEWEASYRLNPQPFVLKNIGLTQKALFRYSEAIVTLEKYLASTTKFQAPDPQETQKVIMDMKALLADVTVTVSPDGAQINVDGRSVGVSPLPRVLQLATGTHSIEVSADGYEPAKKDVMVSAGVPLTVELALKEIPTKGKLKITSPIARAQVSIDGKPVGTVPLEIELEGGGHRVEVSAPKYKPSSSEVVVIAGQNREIGVPLERDTGPKKKQWYMNKYVWAGAGAGVLGIIVLGVALSGTEGPIDGTLGTGSKGTP